MAHSNVRVTELDFDQIKSNLKAYLRTRPEFTDFDFEASNLSVLVDLLAYNTHYNAVLANMVSNEMFLDTALKRSSVVSLAKNIGYTPRSITSARATINLAVQNVTSAPNYLTLERYTPFTTSIDGISYTFYNIDSYSTTPVGGVYTFNGVKLYQGRKLDYFYTVTDATPAAKYVIPNKNVDTATLQVAIQYAGVGGYSDTFELSTDLLSLTSSSKVFFLQENTEGFYEIHFGDGVLGVAPSVGDSIRISYLISDGAAANVGNNASISWTTTTITGEGSADRSISTVYKPSGGSDGDSLDDIRFYALHNYETGGRAVTENDYASIITANLPGAQSVNVWGGEKNTPPVWGKTFISIMPKTGYVLTDSEKTNIIENILKPRGIMTSEHEFVNPDYTYMTFNINIRYNSARTTLSADQIGSLANAEVQSYMTSNLTRFNANFYRSQLEERIMNIDDSIISSNVLFGLEKRIPVVPGVRLSGLSGFTLPAKIHPNELRTSYFYYTDANGLHVAQVRDVPNEAPPDYEGSGTLKTFDLSTNEILDDNLGTIDYGTGVIALNAASPLTISGYIGNNTGFYVYAGVQESIGDVYPGFNEILVTDNTTQDVASNIKNGITINVVAVNK